jgi:CHAT domain-containing protein
MSPASSARNEVSMKQVKEQIDRLLGRVMEEVEDGTPHSARGGGLTSKFMELFEILPQNVRDILRAKSPQSITSDNVPTLLIHLHPQSEWIPWEMLHDGENYLGLRWQIARLPIVSTSVNAHVQRSHQVQTIFSLLGRNVLEEAEEKLWSNTFNGLPQEHRIPPAGGGDYANVDVIANARDADILHITCHGGIKNDDGEFVWTLDHRNSATFSYHITSTVVNSLRLRARPLVFGNACASSLASNTTGADADNNTHRRGLIPGFGTSFFAQGVLNFVGTFAPVTKSVAIEFAHIFYQNLLGQNGQPGSSIGRALWKTKTQFYERDVQGQANKPDLSYLFYCLYGVPDTVYQI